MPTSGEILMDGQPLTLLPPFKRDLNTVFQQYALFPHMSVRDNVGYGLRMRKVASAPRSPSGWTQALDMVQLGHLARPGAEAACRADSSSGWPWPGRWSIVPGCSCSTSRWARSTSSCGRKCSWSSSELNRQLGHHLLYVTHDQEEALTMSDRIALMRNGRIEQLSGPREMYDRPVSRYVADFIGETNLLAGNVVGRTDGQTDGRTR